MTQNTVKPNFKKPKIGLLPVILLIVSIVFFFLFRNAKKDSELLLREGTVIEGTIADKRISTSDEYGDKYYIEYQYIYDYEEYKDENRVYGELYERKSINDTIPVRIQRRNPGNSQINSSLVFPKSEDRLVIAFALLISSVMFIIIQYYKPIKKYFKSWFF